MQFLKKVSDITVQDVAEFIRLEEVSPAEEGELSTYLYVAKSYLKSYTGLTEGEIDGIPDLIEPVLMYCQDMFDNRSIYVDTDNINRVFDATMGLHARNLL